MATALSLHAISFWGQGDEEDIVETQDTFEVTPCDMQLPPGNDRNFNTIIRGIRANHPPPSEHFSQNRRGDG